MIVQILVALALAASSAAAEETGSGGWQRSPSQSFTVPAGALCPFALQADVVADKVMTQVVSTFANGSPREQVYVGELIFRFTNVDGGKSVVRNLSGDGLVEYQPDGAATWTYAGPAAFAFFPGDSLAAGFWVLHGLHVIEVAADGSRRQLVVDDGPKENLCTTLR
jgi:hypothetical protein